MDNDKLNKLLDRVIETSLDDDSTNKAVMALLDEAKTYSSIEKVILLVKILEPAAKKLGIDQYITELAIKTEDTKSFDAVYSYALLCLLNNKEEQTFEFLNNILEKNPNAPIHMSLGDMYYYGIGVSQDFDVATKLYSKAVSNNEVEYSVIEEASKYYLDSAEEAKDIGEKMHYYELAFRYGNITAGNALGSIEYTDSKGVDFHSVFARYENTARAGEQAIKYRPKNDKTIITETAIASAFNNMGVLIINAGCVDASPQALEYFEKAASLGSSIGQYNVGYMYFYGLGVIKNKEEGIKMFKKAASDGCQEAIKLLNKLQVNNQK